MNLDDALAALSRKFQHRCVHEAATLRRLIAADELNGPSALHFAHSLAGAGGTFGFPRVSRAARSVELTLKAGQPAADADIADLLAALDGCARSIDQANETNTTT